MPENTKTAPSSGVPSPDRPAGCTCFTLRKAARAVTQAFDADLQASGLKTTQFSLLAVITRLGQVPMGRLADESVMDRTTLTRNLKPLESKGLIRIEPGEDRRARLVSITEDGREALSRALPLWRKAQARMVETLGQRPWSELMRGLAATIDVARRG